MLTPDRDHRQSVGQQNVRPNNARLGKAVQSVLRGLVKLRFGRGEVAERGGEANG